MASSITASSNAPKHDLGKYNTLLHRAIMKADWDKTQEFIQKDKDALNAALDGAGDRPIHYALGSVKNVVFFEKLLNVINPESLLIMVDIASETALYRAAVVGNTKAAELLVEKYPQLLFIAKKGNYLPIHGAIFCTHKTTFLFLLDACKKHIHLAPQDCNPFEGRMGYIVLISAISSGFLDEAYDLVMDYPHLAITMDEGSAPLHYIADKPDAYYSGSQYNFYQRFIYTHVPIEINSVADKYKIPDVEDQDTNSTNSITKHRRSRFYSVIKKIHLKFWNVSLLYVPHVKRLQESKVKHNKSIMLLERICEELHKQDIDDDYKHYGRAFIKAVLNDTVEVVREIVDSIPRSIWSETTAKEMFPQLAITYRCQNVYNFLVHEVTHNVTLFKDREDKDGNNLLHLAGRLAPLHKLNLVSGAALQMQRELQWFKEVERFMRPKDSQAKNKEHETPIMVFRKEHEKLKKEAEEWIKKTSDSCTITAALIITIVFAAAITVPGGTNGADGKAIFIARGSFIVFAISDAISLFTSTTSLLLFLSILTARYAEDDFLYKLPKRLILGLAMLFISVTSMMIAFSATLYLMFGHGKAWIVFPIAMLACLPITSFVTLQLPLLFELVTSTYGNKLFRKQSDHRIKNHDDHCAFPQEM